MPHSINATTEPRDGSVFQSMLDVLLPPRCVLCYQPVQGHVALCGTCWEGLSFIDGPICQRTGTPLPYDLGPETVSLNAMMRPPAYDCARAALIYDGAARLLIRRFKFHDRLELRQLLLPFMLRAGADFWPDADVIMPVPLHWTRLLMRRYNQSAELARGLSKHTQIPMQVNWLRRVKRTRQQIGLTRPMRKQNLQGAFAIAPRHRAKLKDKHVVLVDDVLTTGATVEACAKICRRAGVAKISVLTAARVVMPEIVHI